MYRFPLDYYANFWHFLIFHYLTVSFVYVFPIKRFTVKPVQFLIALNSSLPYHFKLVFQFKLSVLIPVFYNLTRASLQSLNCHQLLIDIAGISRSFMPTVYSQFSINSRKLRLPKLTMEFITDYNFCMPTVSAILYCYQYEWYWCKNAEYTVCIRHCNISPKTCYLKANKATVNCWTG